LLVFEVMFHLFYSLLTVFRLNPADE
jgi:hypothetical protein